MIRNVTISAPGKVLIAGGYLVLESPNKGIVLAATNCCFHSTIIVVESKAIGESQLDLEVVKEENDKRCIRLNVEVHSPQFHVVYSYWLELELKLELEDGLNLEFSQLQLVPKEQDGNRNEFLEKTLSLVFAYVLRQFDGDFDKFLQFGWNGEKSNIMAIKLRADNDFYSQIHHLEGKGMKLTPGNMARLEPFLPCPKDETVGTVTVNKTGMGSSAALVTSLVGSLLVYFDIVSLPISECQSSTGFNPSSEMKNGVEIVHNLSQICHSLAQGKVGSGFDIASACFGSLAYTRFHPDLISNLPQSNEDTTSPNALFRVDSSLSLKIYNLVSDVSKWDYSKSPINLPQGMELLMADVCGGSESPSMAKRVMKWRKTHESKNFDQDNEIDIWELLRKGNESVLSVLNSFPKDLGIIGVKLSSLSYSEWKGVVSSKSSDNREKEIARSLILLHDIFKANRLLLKSMGEKAGDVPIEPDSQSLIANTTEKVRGVIACGIPGAGGYDALFVLYLKGAETDRGNSDSVRDEISRIWENAANDSVKICPLNVRSSSPNNWGGIRNSSTHLGW